MADAEDVLSALIRTYDSADLAELAALVDAASLGGAAIGTGLGRELFRAGLLALRQAGMESASLGVDVDNVTGADRLYASEGFAAVSRRPMYRTELTAGRPATY